VGFTISLFVRGRAFRARLSKAAFSCFYPTLRVYFVSSLFVSVPYALRCGCPGNLAFGARVSGGVSG